MHIRKRLFLITLALTLAISCKKESPVIRGPFVEVEEAIQTIITNHAIPGVSISIAHAGKLVYVHSFGLADKESQQMVTTSSLFRIASISKPITAIALLRLVQENKLSLEDKVFGDAGILRDFGKVPAGSAIDQITVRHLMDHKSGWVNVPDDPMFSNASLTSAQLIKQVVENRPLTNAPGSTYYYLNFGYCVLGRVIETITGIAYDQYVKSEVLAPAGIDKMRIGENMLSNRFPDEVKYYQTEWDPYSINLSRMDSHGGWIASSTDLLRFMMLVDRNKVIPDMIDESLLNQFLFGFNNWIHFGSLPGTSSVLTRLNDDVSFAILANTRAEYDGALIPEELNNTVSEILTRKTEWPATDLF